MKEYESACKDDALNKSWLIKHRSMEYMENKFKQEEQFDLMEDEPLKDCFCKI